MTLQCWDSYAGLLRVHGWILYPSGTDLTKPPKERETHRCQRTESTSSVRHLNTLECSAQKKDECERLRRSVLVYLKTVPLRDSRPCLLCMQASAVGPALWPAERWWCAVVKSMDPGVTLAPANPGSATHQPSPLVKPLDRSLSHFLQLRWAFWQYLHYKVVVRTQWVNMWKVLLIKVLGT